MRATKSYSVIWPTGIEHAPTITRPDPWNKGKAGAPTRREFEPDSWDRWISARRFEYKPLDDAAYTIRYRTLCFHYHPAVAAILAHDPIHGPGCAERRGKRTRREP